MQQKVKIVFIVFTLFITHKVIGQTPFLSQNFAATNFFNPASVGFGEYNQFNSFYKNQYAGVGDPYRTIGVSADFKLNKREYWEPNQFGVGIQAVSEKVLNGALQTNYISVQFANRIFLNKKLTSFLSLGIGGTVISRNIDKDLITFGDQYNSGRLFNATSAESIASIPVRFASSVGVLFGNNTDKQFLQLGVSGYYIDRSTFNQSYNKVNQNFQFVGLANFEHQIWYDKTVLFHADYQTRLESEFYYAGIALGFPIYDYTEQTKRFYIGCFYRANDATIPYVGLLLGKYKLGLSYDVYQNNMTSANLHPQTIEFNFSALINRNQSNKLITLFN
jgi:type IX secretion system PorP/SprF family membrane protein